ncbi:S-adenosyl-L-methionine-dependent methyltransferase [Phycomyces blakesleeanus]|uniref:S-adenosyl-L-methionine-dependent methyltransferase n=1 Tax=Phycomyces blakesleeanus TaxID=4837 RepID=A0ABR3AVH9_PHYBL
MGTHMSIPKDSFKRHSGRKSDHSNPTSHSTIETLDTRETYDSRGSEKAYSSPLACFDPHRNGDSDRMSVQHFGLKALFEGNILKNVNKYVDFDSPTRILDLGVGTGSWIMDVATENPNATCIGIDKLPIFPQAIRPPNVTFQILDILDGLPYQDNYFDFVQLRLFGACLQLTNWPIVLKEVYRVLRPGGCVQLLECLFEEATDEFLTVYTNKLRVLMAANDLDVHIAKQVGKLLADSGYTVIQEELKEIDLRNPKAHLAKEFMYIIDESINGCRPILYEIYGVATDKEFAVWKAEYLAARRNSSFSRWYAAAGMKPIS